jgi:hypothetical protein
LRLWIELLKNSYYTKESGYKELETLPNLDVNIKAGNSLISRFKLNTDITNAAYSLKSTIKEYKEAVRNYRNLSNKKRQEKTAGINLKNKNGLQGNWYKAKLHL